MAEQVHLHRDTTLQNGRGGAISIGAATHIQPRCQISAYKGSVHIGEKGEIAPNCAFYPYDHCWLGFGVIVLDGVHIGNGAIVGAGSVVTKNIPENCIAVGNPAYVIKTRSESAKKIS